MRTQIAKTGYLPAEYIRVYFRLVPPPPFAQVDGGGCYRENFFDFQTSISTRILFFYFFSDFRLASLILGFQLNSFSEYPSF